jgi:hypothetical protein
VGSSFTTEPCRRTDGGDARLLPPRRLKLAMVLNMDINELFSDENITLLQQITFSSMTAAARMVLCGVLNEHFIDALSFAAKEEQKRIAIENDFA